MLPALWRLDGPHTNTSPQTSVRDASKSSVDRRAALIPRDRGNRLAMEAESRPLLPIFPYFACFQAGVACLLALSPPRPGKLAGCAALTSFVSLAYLCSTGDAARNYGVGNLMMIQAVTAYLLLWLVNPLYDYRHESDYTHPTKYSFVRRFWWMLSIINNPRGVGWSYEVSVTMDRGGCAGR